MDVLTRIPVREQDAKERAANFEEVCLGYNKEEAQAEAARCINCKNAQCVRGCPVAIDIPGFIEKVKEGQIEEAYQVISEASALPAVCGRVCPQETQCEGKCIRGIKGDPVSIGKLERFVADWARENGIKPHGAAEKKGKKVAVIGSGPAGLTCAGDLAKMGYEVTIFEALHEPGGVLVYGIPEFRLPKSRVVAEEIENVKALGVKIETNVVVGKSVTIDELIQEEGFEAVFIGSGAGLPKFMGIPGENSNGVFSANEYLTRSNLMKAFDAGSNTPIMKSRKVAVVGGGNVAIDVARTAVRCGAESVKMFCLEPRDKMPASEEEIEGAAADGVALDCGWGPKEIRVENGKVTGVVFKKCVSVWDAEGRFNPTYDENDTMTVDCDRVFLSIGQSIIWGNLLKGSRVKLGRGQGAEADKLTYQTAQPDIFVGGDVYTGPKFAIDAIAAGKEAAVSLHRFVQPNTSLTIGRNRRDFIELDKTNALIDINYDTAPRQKPGYNEALRRTFRDGSETFTEEQVRAETARCLSCGASVVDPNKCIGCGLCTTKCGFDAIHLHRERPECSTMIKAEDKMKAILPYMVKRQFRIKRAGKGK